MNVARKQLSLVRCQNICACNRERGTTGGSTASSLSPDNEAVNCCASVADKIDSLLNYGA